MLLQKYAFYRIYINAYRTIIRQIVQKYIINKQKDTINNKK